MGRQSSENPLSVVFLFCLHSSTGCARSLQGLRPQRARRAGGLGRTHRGERCRREVRAEGLRRGRRPLAPSHPAATSEIVSTGAPQVEAIPQRVLLVYCLLIWIVSENVLQGFLLLFPPGTLHIYLFYLIKDNKSHLVIYKPGAT